ncbi:hypothetical protein [Streptomyces siamensis]|uniref:Uncharacterized protein n=1 Tax=Streptomyces siamensis TaxID=1274986 RepID=A0ABP9JH73_9ACTN
MHLPAAGHARRAGSVLSQRYDAELGDVDVSRRADGEGDGLDKDVDMKGEQASSGTA